MKYAVHTERTEIMLMVERNLYKDGVCWELCCGGLQDSSQTCDWEEAKTVAPMDVSVIDVMG